MVDGLFFYTTLTGPRGSHIPFVHTVVEKSDTGAEAVKPDPSYSCEGHSAWVGPGVGHENAESLWGCPSIPHSIDDPPTARHLCCCCQIS